MKRIILLLLLPALAVSLLGGCGGGGSGTPIPPAGENPGVPFSVQLTPSHSIAQTNSSIVLRAKVLNGNGVPMANVPVTFTNLSEPFGVIQSVLRSTGLGKSRVVLSAKVVNTDASGMATATIRSSVSGFATIQAEINTGSGIVRDKKVVMFSDTFNLPTYSALPQLSLDVDTTPSFLTPNEPNDFVLLQSVGDIQRYIRATVLFDQTVSGKIVNFSSDSTDVTFCQPASPPTSPPTCQSGGPSGLDVFLTTDSNGQATVLVTVGPSAITNNTQTINIMAVAEDGAFSIVTLFLEPVVIAPPPASSLAASPTSVALTSDPQNPGPENKSTITATVKLNTGGFAPDATTVNFTATCGTVDAFAQTTNGIATATFTAPATFPDEGICTVTGTAGGVNIGSADIEIIETVPLGIIAGTVLDTLGAPLSGVTVNLSYQGVLVSSVTNNPGGTYSFTVPALAGYSVEFSKSGYIASTVDNVTVTENTTTTVDAVLTVVLAGGETRIVLTWGQTPSDLDSHLTGPDAEGSSTRFHVYYGAPCYPSGSCSTDINGNRIAGVDSIALLDHDDTSSFGPETTTLVQQFSGVYRFSVQDYSNKSSTNSLALSNSGAQVKVYQGSNLLQTFFVPTNQVGTLWTVFEMEGTQITPVNTMTNESDQTAIQRAFGSAKQVEK